MIVQKISSIKPARQDGVVDLLENCRTVANMSFTLSFPYSYACISMYSCSYLLGVCGAFELAHCEFSSCNYFPEWRLSVTLTFSTGFNRRYKIDKNKSINCDQNINQMPPLTSSVTCQINYSRKWHLILPVFTKVKLDCAQINFYNSYYSYHIV